MRPTAELGPSLTDQTGPLSLGRQGPCGQPRQAESESDPLERARRYPPHTSPETRLRVANCFAANHTGTRDSGVAAVARRVIVAAASAVVLLSISSCSKPQKAETFQHFPLGENGAALLKPAPNGPWSGLWSVEGGSLDSELRITHLGNDVYVVEGIGRVNAVMHGIANPQRLKAHEGGRGNRVELVKPDPDHPCIQGWQIPPSAGPVPMLACRAG